jgi:hypothetical protein
MWNKQNAYNTPKSQMERLKQAGLNPNMVYGTGTVSGNTSGQMPQYNAPSAEYHVPDFNMPNVVGEYQQIKLAEANIDRIKQATLTDGQRMINEAAKTLGIMSDSQKKRTSAQIAKSTQQYMVEAQKLAVDQAKSRIGVSNSQIALNDARRQGQLIANKIQDSGKVGPLGNSIRVLEGIYRDAGLDIREAKKEVLKHFRNLPERLFNDVLKYLTPNWTDNR